MVKCKISGFNKKNMEKYHVNVLKIKSRWAIIWVLIGCFWILIQTTIAQSEIDINKQFRPPAIPLVVCDPYFSTWSLQNHLYDGGTKHWTEKNHRMSGAITIDGNCYRFMGLSESGLAPIQQESLAVQATQTIYKFCEHGIELTLTFLTPALLEDLDVYARPITYVDFAIESIDAKNHSVKLYVDVSGQWAVNLPDQHVVWSRKEIGKKVPLTVMQMGSEEQPILLKKGDDLRIDWGYFYLATTQSKEVSTSIASAEVALSQFQEKGTLPPQIDHRMPRAANDDTPVMAYVWNPEDVTPGTLRSQHIILAYDDVYSIQYFQKNLQPYWRRNGMSIDELLAVSETQYKQLTNKCNQFDEQLENDARQAGGVHYAKMCELVYRQCLGAHKLVIDGNNTPLYFSKECFSNGCIATVDVTYPTAPFFLYFNRTLLKGQLIPIFTYAASDAWPHVFAPHDVGIYPHANGQMYGETQSEGQMPVEESGNMLIMTAGICKFDGNTDFAEKYWDLLTKWAEYLRNNGLDPINQLCTADMFGQMPHNADLSLKAIIGLGGYALMAEMMGKDDIANTYQKIAKDYAEKWQVMARDEKWNTRLTFDQPGTWGMKHNLVWDRVLGLNLFPETLGEGEIKTYYVQSNKYGFPCDNRTQTSLLDWAVWCACLAQNQQDFIELTTSFYEYANETPDRIPLSDWFFTTNGNRRGFQARSVVGGIFMRFLAPSTSGVPQVITDELRNARKQYIEKPQDKM